MKKKLIKTIIEKQLCGLVTITQVLENSICNILATF